LGRGVVSETVLPGVETSGDGGARARGGRLSGVWGGRITATDMTASGTATGVEPPPGGRPGLHASPTPGRGGRIDHVTVRHVRSSRGRAASIVHITTLADHEA